MRELLKNAEVYGFGKADILLDNFVISDIAKNISAEDADCVYNLKNMHIFPGFTDVHVHLREPGFSYKETVLSGTKAAAHGGYSAVCAMPNLNPVPHNAENLKLQSEYIERDAVVKVYPYGAITKDENGEELSDMEQLSSYVAAFSDDGRGVQSSQIMKAAMQKSKELKKIIAAHCEDNSLLNGGYIHDGEYALKNGHCGICSKSEWAPIQRDIALAEETKCSYHVCHISAKESVELIRRAKAKGIDITCETAPHYLVFDDMDLKNDGRFKMNPPIRSKEDKSALIQGIKDGTVDMIATDHAPHTADEKSKGLKDSLNGIVGLETAFSVMYTNFVKTNIITLNRLIELMSINPSQRFGIDNEIAVGKKANFTVFDLNAKYIVDSKDFLSKGKSSPFEGMMLYGKCLMTYSDGKTAWIDKGGNYASGNV